MSSTVPRLPYPYRMVPREWGYAYRSMPPLHFLPVKENLRTFVLGREASLTSSEPIANGEPISTFAKEIKRKWLQRQTERLR